MLLGVLTEVNFMDRSERKVEIKQIVHAALTIAARRREILLRLRKALETDNVEEAIKLAKELCGLNE